MSLPGAPHPLFSFGKYQYEIKRSLRFNSADSAYLSRTPASAGNRKTWTWAGWVKRSAVGSYQQLLTASSSATVDDQLRINDSNKLEFLFYNNASDAQLVTTAVFRDPSAWYHIVCAVDTTQGTASNRIKLYVNGSQQTALDTANYPSADYQGSINGANLHHIGSRAAGGGFFANGYLADIHFIDGQALTPTSFGEFDANGIWQPKAYSGGSYGTNGFRLPFSDNSAATATTLGKDSAGSNNWTPVNLLASATNYGAAVTSTLYDGSSSAVLDQDLTNFVRVATSNYGTTFWTVTFSTPIPITSSVVCRVQSEPGAVNMFRTRINDTTDTIIPAGSSQQDLTLNLGGATTLSKLDFRTYDGSGYGCNLYYIQVDGKTIYTDALVSQVDSLVDSPTSYGTDTGVGGEVRGNYCTLNPLDIGSGLYLSNGNLNWAGRVVNPRVSYGTIAVSSGKYYFETTINGAASGLNIEFGVAISGTSNTIRPGTTASGWQLSSSSTTTLFKFHNNAATSIYTSGLSNGDILSVAVDMNAGRIWFARNGVWLEGDPAAGTGASYTNLSGTVAPFAGTWGSDTSTSSPNGDLNFGQRPFAYTAPSGFKALNTANLPTPTITKGSDYFDTKLYTGNGGTQTISGLGFSPDLVWVKPRSAGFSHGLYDTVRGDNLRLCSNQTAAEATVNLQIGSTGFTVEGSSSYGDSGVTYVGWCWDAGSSTVTNTSGTISSQVRANASAGFSVVTYTGTRTGNGTDTVGHGLGVAPSLVITKSRSNATDWVVQHIGTSTASQVLFLQLTNAQTDTSTFGTLSRPTSSVFSANYTSGMNTNGYTYVAYCWAPVAGYSAFGSYTGNGSTDGPFIFTSFRPRWIMVKRSDSTGNWTIKDTSRPGYNVTNLNLFANLINAETTEYPVDLLSNGFKVREGTFSDWNANGSTYVWAAFAESPFQYSRAR